MTATPIGQVGLDYILLDDPFDPNTCSNCKKNAYAKETAVMTEDPFVASSRYTCYDCAMTVGIQCIIDVIHQHSGDPTLDMTGYPMGFHQRHKNHAYLPCVQCGESGMWRMRVYLNGTFLEQNCCHHCRATVDDKLREQLRALYPFEELNFGNLTLSDDPEMELVD